MPPTIDPAQAHDGESEPGNSAFEHQLADFELSCESQTYPILAFSEFTFTTVSDELERRYATAEAPETFDADISGGGRSFPIKFRIRGIDGDKVRCGFYDLPIRQREDMLRHRERVVGSGSDELHDLSYDELAGGNTTKDSAKKDAGSSDSNEPRRPSGVKKLLAMGVMVLGMVAIFAWILVVIQSRSTVSVSNSVLVGNYQPVNTPFQGRLLEVLVNVGDRVEKGQPVAVVGKDEVQHQIRMLDAGLRRTRSELVAYQNQAKRVANLMEFAKEKTQRDMVVAEAELDGGQAELKAAQAQVDRLQPLIERGNIGVFEVEEAQAFATQAKAAIARQSALIETLQLAKNAADKNVLVNATGVIDPLADVMTKIELAEAAIAEAETVRDSLADEAKPVELFAPQSGTIHAIYRRPGEYLKVAEEAIAVSLDQSGWAAGHIEPNAATEIRPGQHVEIEIPSLGITTTGKVAGIGHRSVYGRGGYNAEFRGGPLEVPIRVELDPSNTSIPSGLRLNMTVRINDRLAQVKDWIRSFSDETKTVAASFTARLFQSE